MEKTHLKMLVMALPLVAVILVSGCVGGGSISGGNGVIILDFKPDFTNVYSQDSAKLQLRVQNQGQVMARNVDATIANLDSTEWNFNNLFSDNLGDLLPYDSITNTPGAIKTKEWGLEAPDLPKGTTYTYEPIIKVSYDYKTTATKPITIVDEDELRRIIQQGKSLPSKATTTTAGPLSVEARTGDYVRTSDTDGQSHDVFPLYIKITNTRWESGGTLINDGLNSFGASFGETYDYPVSITLTPPSGVSSVNSDDVCTGTGIKDLWQGKDTEITCEFRVTNPPEFRQERMFTIELEYRYQTEKSTSITVTGVDDNGFGRLW